MRNASMPERAAMLKALGHPARLMIVHLAWQRPRHGDELATILNLTPATISHHLAQLTSAGLLQQRRDGPYQLYAPNPERFTLTLEDLTRLPHAPSNEESDPYRQKVLRTFLKDGRLSGIPAQRKKRDVILDHLAETFAVGREYSEREVNLRLSEFHDDFFTLRRELIGRGLMTRDQGTYRRATPPAPSGTNGAPPA